MDVYDFGKEKRFKHFSSPSAAFPVNLSLISALADLAPLSASCLFWTQQWHPFSSCPTLDTEKERTLKTGWDQRCLKCSISTASHPLMPLGFFWGFKPSAPAGACLSASGATLWWIHDYGSNSEVMQEMVPGQHLQTLFCIISGFKYYIVLLFQDIFTVLETGNKKIFCLLAGGSVHICSSLI